MAEEMRFAAYEGDREWLARFVAKGDRYGREDRIVHNDGEPLIEIYMLRDGRKDLTRIHGARGYFVSRYDLTAFFVLDYDARGLLLDGGSGLALDGRTRAAISSWARDLTFGPRVPDAAG